MKPVLYLDHDVHLYFVAALRRRGYEASTTQEHGNQRLSDAEQLAFAAERDWAILSYNMGDFNALHTEWIAQGKKHAGILLASQFHPPRTLSASAQSALSCRCCGLDRQYPLSRPVARHVDQE